MTEQDGANALHSSGEEANVDKIEDIEEKSELLHDGEILKQQESTSTSLGIAIASADHAAS